MEVHYDDRMTLMTESEADNYLRSEPRHFGNSATSCSSWFPTTMMVLFYLFSKEDVTNHDFLSSDVVPHHASAAEHLYDWL